ncbi:phosphatase PAP2 family protein [Neobacillus sp. OS1-32]|uniref:phosphatase PAP2 family protein n=1 Tax=Neobacillus sp. OS1-32 TaxID=3070682 RepID=UPI0027DFFCDE|nr:phosphatase PAP2 family protein [Neobacillus sp. OS1-32]WML31596.1 phosphatase PAP2 family protein [Neobacillus sp. OS1-32]
MKLRLYLTIAFVLSVLCIIGFAMVSLFVKDHQIIGFDRTIISAVQGLESPGLTKVMKLFTFIGSTEFVIILSLLLVFFLYKVLQHRLEVVLFIVVLMGSGIINQLLKQFFHRVRPDFHRLIEISGYSFPSGHGMNAFTVYVMISFLLWRHISSRLGRGVLIFFSIMMILAIGISRIYLGVHYPSDVIGGYLASGVWVSMAIFFFQFYKEKRYNRKNKLVETSRDNR